MLVLAGSVDVTTYFQLRLIAGTDATGLTIADFDMQYVRTGATPVAKVDAVALAAANTAHTDNRGIEVDATDTPGLYRFDWPDAAFAAGAREVILTIKHTSIVTESLRVMIDGPVSVGAFTDTGVNDRLSRIGFDVDTGLRTHISDVDTGLHDTLADYDTGVRALLALQDTGRIATAVWAGDTGLRDHINNVDTGLTNRLNIIASDVDTGLRRQINCLDTGIHGVLADYDTGIRGILLTSGVSIDTGIVNQAVWQANGARGITAISDTGLNDRLLTITGQTNKLTFDTGNKVHAAIFKIKGIGIVGSGDTGGGDPFRPLT